MGEKGDRSMCKDGETEAQEDAWHLQGLDTGYH